MRSWLVFVLVAMAVSACAPAAAVIVYSHGTVLAPLGPVFPQPDFRDDSREVAAADDAKRQLENEQSRSTSRRLEHERKVAELSRTDDGDPAPGEPFAEDHLDREAIMSALEVVRPRIAACKVAGLSGQVLVLIKVGADGHTRSVHVERTPDPDLGVCVAQAASYATFAQTTNGASFRYPFVF